MSDESRSAGSAAALSAGFALALAFVGATSCGPAQDESAAVGDDHAAADRPRDPGLHAVGLELDDGQKWPMDAHTRRSFSRMVEMVQGAAPGSLGATHELGEQLKSQLGELIAGCTMTGEAHDQLHVFLQSFFPAVNALATETDEEQAHVALARVETLLEDYQRYFE